jgi:radial spoke head protein 9
VIMKIDEEAMLVPRGAFLRSPAGIVMKNGSFSGLDDKQVSNLENWFHFSGPIKLPKKSLLEKADLAAPIDFLEQASIDVPLAGSWSIQSERGPGVDSSLIKLRSLHWPGAESCHIPNTKQFARAYFGDGLKNINLPFMLPSSS